MLKRLIAGALFAGLSAGALGALLQLTFVVPLIHEAELYESGALTPVTAATGHDHGAAEVAPHDHPPGTPEDHDHPVPAETGHDHAAGLEMSASQRMLGTIGAFMVTYTGFALVMVAGFALATRAGHPVTARQGALWGLAGFVAVQLAPAFGLPPELPGASAAALEARQLWWAACVAASVAALALLAYGKGPLALALGVVLLALPHLIGAPSADYGGVVPSDLAAHFVTRSLGAGALCWVLLGTIAAAIWTRDA